MVSSGAIALGRNVLEAAQGRAASSRKARPPPRSGRSRWRSAYADAFRARAAWSPAQVLLTLGDTEERRRYLNARDTSRRCSRSAPCRSSTRTTRWRPSEIRYGDNDRLAARVASMMGADCLVLLSDVDGLLHRAAAARAPMRGGSTRSRDDHAGDRGDGRAMSARSCRAAA